MTADYEKNLSKVPAATAAFWIIKLLATTLGEVGGNAISMDLGLGYLSATGLLASLFLILVAVQVSAKQFDAPLYWATIVASTTAGTTLADYTTRSLGIGYTGGSALLLALVLISLFSWRATLGNVSSDAILDRRAELFYWMTITFSQTLGTALGDWFADTMGFGYVGSTAIFSAALIFILILHYRRAVDGVILFWAAFIVTRPFGAVAGNIFDKPVEQGGMGLSRPMICLVLSAVMIAGLFFFPHRAAHAPQRGKTDT